MAIKDRPNRRLPRLGIIRLGYKKTKTYEGGRTVEYPVAANHFVLTDAPDVAAVYGEKPTELDVLLLWSEVERNFAAWYQVWAGGVLVCKGDGKYVDYATPLTTRVDPKGNTHVGSSPGDTLVSGGVALSAFTWNGVAFEEGEIVPCPGRRKGAYPHCEACRLHGVLKMGMADPRLFKLGYYQLSTGSGRNHDTILGTLETIPASKLAGLPCTLRLVEQQTSYQDDDGKRHQTRKHFLQLEPDAELMRKLYERRVRLLVEGPEPEAPVLRTDAEAFLAGLPAEDAKPVPPPYAVVGADPAETDGWSPAWSAKYEAPPPQEPVGIGELVTPPVPVSVVGEQAQHGHWEDLPPPSEEHWLNSTTRRRRFEEWTSDAMTITDEKVLEALDVPTLQHYQGTPADAKEAVIQYVAAHLDLKDKR